MTSSTFFIDSATRVSIFVARRVFSIAADVLLFLTLLFIVMTGSSMSFAQEFEWPYRTHLQREIRFWKDIFTKYNDSQYVLHDPEDLSIVYKVINISGDLPEQERSRKIALEKYEITKLLLEIAKKIEQGESLEKHEREIVRLFGDRPDSHMIRLCAHRVRAQQGICNRFQRGVERSHAYLPLIKKIFREAGLPEELAYLPHVESSFNPLARSRSGAVGIWQFMPKTARMFMKINSVIDERYDINVSTKAACALLQLNYKETRDWGLAITAYNHGLNGMIRAAAQCGTNYLDVRRKYTSPTFQFASKNFYPEFLAAVEIMRNLPSYFPSLKYDRMPSIIRYTLKKPTSLPLLARRCNIDMHLLKELNPAYTQKAWQGRVPVPAGYALNLPGTTNVAAVNSFVESYAETAAAETEKGKKTAPSRTASVKTEKDVKKEQTSPKTETVKAVARESDNQTRSIASSAAAGLPDRGKAIATADLSLDSIRKEMAEVLSVRKDMIQVFGDETVGHYAQWLNVPSSRLFKINALSPKQVLKQKQKLRLDFSKTTPEEFHRRRLEHHMACIENFVRQNNLDALLNYKLGHGETLLSVAQNQYKVPPRLVLYFNPLQNLNSLSPGSVIKIPVSRSQLAAKQSS